MSFGFSKEKINIFFIFFIAILLSISFDFDQNNTFFYFFGLFVSGICFITVFFIPRKHILLPLLVFLILAKDTTQGSEEIEKVGVILSATPWQQKIFNFSPASIFGFWLIFVFLRLFDFKFKFTITFLYLFIFSVLVSFWFGYPQENLGKFFTDLKVPFFFFLGVSIFENFFKRFPNQLYKIAFITLIFIAARTVVDAFYLIANVGDKLNTSNYLSFDSTKGIILILIFYIIERIISGKNIFLNIIFLALTFTVLIAYQTKWLILMFFVGLLFFFILIDNRNKLKLFLFIAFFSVLILPILFYSFPVVFELIYFRFLNLLSLDSSSEINDIDLIRTGSIINSLGFLYEKNSILTGLGYGSWFNDQYFPMVNVNSSSFDEDSILSGKYYRVHDYFFYFLMKFGLIGLYLFTRLFFLYIYKLNKIRKQYFFDSSFQTILIIIACSSIGLLTSFFWTGKGLLLIALFVIVSKYLYLKTTVQGFGK